MAKKIEVINNQQNKIISDLNVKNQTPKPLLIDNYNWRNHSVIDETEWVTQIPTYSSADKSGTKNEMMPQYITLNSDFNVVVPKKFLPFLKLNILTKTPPELSLVGMLAYNRSTYEADYVEVYGNSIDEDNLIYKGSPRPIYYLHTLLDLAAGKFLESNTKKVYRGVITYTEGGSEYKIDGTLIKALIRTDAGLSPGGNQNYDDWDAYIDPSYGASNNYSKILDIDSTSIHAISVKYPYRWETNPSPPPTEILYTPTGIPNQEIEVDFADTIRQSFKVKLASKYKKVGANWVYQSSGDFTADSEDVTLLTYNFYFSGYWLFYEPTTKYLFGIRDCDPIVIEGSFNKKELYNLPIDPDRDWTRIIFTRNPAGHPITYTAAYLAKSNYQIGVINVYPSATNPDHYLIKVDGTIQFQSPALEHTRIQYPLYYDVYNQDATTYVPTENHSLKDVWYYQGTNKAVDYKLQLVLINPLDADDRKNYEL